METEDNKPIERKKVATAEELRKLLDVMRTDMIDKANAGKSTVADFVRLVQLCDELEDAAPGEIRIVWVRNDTSSGT